MAFKEFIHKLLEVYFDDWTMFRLVKHHAVSLCLMLDTRHRYQIALNLKKCIFCDFWNFSRPCSMQEGIDGGPCEDSSNCEFRSSQEC